MHPYDDWGSDYAVGDILSNYYVVPKVSYKTVEVALEHETDKAYLFGKLMLGTYTKFWLPKSQVRIIESIGKNYTIKIPDWLIGKRAK